MKKKIKCIVKKALKKNVVILLENEEVTLYKRMYVDWLNDLGKMD